MVKVFHTLSKRWKQYKYRFVPWIAFNLRKRKLRAVEGGSNDKVIPDSKVEQSLLIFFTGLSKTKQKGSADQIHDPRDQRSGGQLGENIGSKGHVHSVQLSHWCQILNKKGCLKSGHTPTQKETISCEEIVNKRNMIVVDKESSIGFKFLQALNGSIHAQTHTFYSFLKFLRSDIFRDKVAKCLFEESPVGHICNQPNFENPVLARKQKPTILATLTESTSRSFATVTSQRCTNRVQTVEGSRVSCDWLELMHKLLGFTIERRPSSIAGAGTGVFVTRGTIPAETVVAMYPGTVYKSWEPILLQSLANPFIFRCLDGTLIDGNDKGVSRMVYRSCTQRDRMGPYLTSDLSWLTASPTNPMAIGQYVNNQSKDSAANVAYQEFDVPDSFPFQLLQYIPNVFYSSTYQQSDPSSQRLMRTVVLVSLREIECGEELLSSYFTIVH